MTLLEYYQTKKEDASRKIAGSVTKNGTIICP